MSPQHQKFAELIAIGTLTGKAYAEAYGKESITASVIAASKRLATKTHIIAKVQEIRDLATLQSEADAVLTLVEKRRILARIVRTPVTLLDPKNETTHDLIKKVTRKMIGSGEDAYEVEEIEGYDKIKAIVEDTNLAGDGAEAENFRTLNQILGNIPTSGMIRPTDSME